MAMFQPPRVPWKVLPAGAGTMPTPQFKSGLAFEGVLLPGPSQDHGRLARGEGGNAVGFLHVAYAGGAKADSFFR